MEHEDEPSIPPPSEPPSGSHGTARDPASEEADGDPGGDGRPRGEPAQRASGGGRQRPRKGPGSHPNNVRRLRIERMFSKAELARRARLSVLTIDRVEKGYGCRMDTKRKILEALGLSLSDRVRVFGEEE